MRHLLCCVAVLALASCSSETTQVTDKSASTAPAETTPTDQGTPDLASSSKASDEAATQLLSAMPPVQNIPPVFASLGDCEKSGATLPSCARAQNIAKVMAQLDAPKFSNDKSCAQVFQNCTQVEGKFFPQAVSFGLGGNAQSAPTVLNPAEIVPVYMNKEGVPVVLRSSVEGLYVMQPTNGKTAPFTFKPQ